MSDGSSDNDLPAGLAAPARRALADTGIQTLDQLTKLSEAELRELHGVGTNAVKLLLEAVRKSGRRLA
jgi:predicted RecB family nuclease